MTLDQSTSTSEQPIQVRQAGRSNDGQVGDLHRSFDRQGTFRLVGIVVGIKAREQPGRSFPVMGTRRINLIMVFLNASNASSITQFNKLKKISITTLATLTPVEI